MTGASVQWNGSQCTVDGGKNLLELIREAGQLGHGGWEKLAGIPGTIGGAVRGNAGAFGSEIKDFVHSVTALNADTNEVRSFLNTDCSFAYRNSFFKQNPAWIILSTTVLFHNDSSENIVQGIETTIAERERRHLQNVRAAGSYFMNPVAPKEIQELFEREKGIKAREGRVPAGWLIEKAGMKGACSGGAQASLQHPNYLVNESGTATAHDVLALAEEIKKAVYDMFGIALEEEAARL
jgi:UDP-N-acetylmuramate dehydrogenase